VTRHDPDESLAGRHNAGSVGADNSAVRATDARKYFQYVVARNVLRQHNNRTDARIDCVDDRILCHCRRNKNDRNIARRVFRGLRRRAEKPHAKIPDTL